MATRKNNKSAKAIQAAVDKLELKVALEKKAGNIVYGTMPSVTLEDIKTAGTAQQNLSASFLFDGSPIVENLKDANRKRGGLRAVLTGFSNPDISAVKYLLDQDTSELRKVWESHVTGGKAARIHPPTLQKLKSLARKAGTDEEDTPKKPTWQECALAAWAQLSLDQREGLPVAIYDRFCDEEKANAAIEKANASK